MLLPFEQVCYHQFTFHENIGYFAYTFPPYGTHTCGVISLFELNLISKVTLCNEKYLPYDVRI